MLELKQIPLVSVVLTTYNGESFLRAQLDSLIQQSYPHIEIIAVDDRSSDNTVSILKEYALNNDIFKVFVNEVNLGYIKNFEKACGLAEGEFIALCDQDDVWHKDKVKSMAESIGNHGMVYCDSLICNKNLQEGKKLSKMVNFRSRYSCLEVTVFCRIYGNATLFKKSLLLAAYPFPKCIPHDWWLSYIATLNGGIKYFDEALIYYRQHNANVIGAIGGRSRKKITENKRQKKKAEIACIRERINIFFNTCPNEISADKKILSKLFKSYQSFSLFNNILRMITFFQCYKVLLYVKKRSLLRKYLFCLKMFVMIK